MGKNWKKNKKNKKVKQIEQAVKAGVETKSLTSDIVKTAVGTTVKSGFKSGQKVTIYQECHEITEIIPNLFIGSLRQVKDMIQLKKVDVLIPLDSLAGSIWNWGFRGEIHYCPITDYGSLPDDVFENLIQYILECTTQGKKVGLFCIGGHGRTGYVAAGCVGRLYPETDIEDPVEYVRTLYCDLAIESLGQIKSLATATNRPWLVAEYEKGFINKWDDWDMYGLGAYGGYGQYGYGQQAFNTVKYGSYGKKTLSDYFSDESEIYDDEDDVVEVIDFEEEKRIRQEELNGLAVEDLDGLEEDEIEMLFGGASMQDLNPELAEWFREREMFSHSSVHSVHSQGDPNDPFGFDDGMK